MRIISGRASDKPKRPEGVPDSIRDWEINKGGWRFDGEDNEYWLSYEQLLEFAKKDLELEDDDEAFFTWFEDYKIQQKLFKRTYRGTTASSSWKKWDDGGKSSGDGFWGSYSSKSSISGYWAKGFLGSYGSYSRGTEIDKRLAMLLRPVRSIIRVVDDRQPPMQVDWSSQDNPVSYTDFETKHIVVNPEPVLDKELSDEAAIDVVAGYALHEAGHSVSSEPPYRDINASEDCKPKKVSGLLLNVAEDVRTEAKTSDDFPGFAGYFEKSLDYSWNKKKKIVDGLTYGPDLNSKLQVVIEAVRWQKQFTAICKDAETLREVEWWADWRDRYSPENAVTHVIEALKHLRIPTEEEEGGEGEGKGKEEGGEGEGEGQAGKDLDQMIADEAENPTDAKEGGSKLADDLGIDICVGKPSYGSDLSPETSRIVKQLLDEEVEDFRPGITPVGRSTGVPVTITRPKEHPSSKDAYVGKPGGDLAKLRAALIFRQELPEYDNRLLNEGGLDDEELWRWGAGDYRLFKERVIVTRPNVQLSLLVDLSGSMYGTKLRHAQRLAQLFVWAVQTMPTVHTKVFGHTGDVTSLSADIFRLWEPGDPMTRLGLIATLPHSQNYDGYAIEYVVKEVLARGDGDEQRVVVVLSDGWPAAHNYGGITAMNHVRAVTEWARKQGVTVIQIAIDEALRPEDQNRMFREWVPFTGDMSVMPRKLEKILERYT